MGVPASPELFVLSNTPPITRVSPFATIKFWVMVKVLMAGWPLTANAVLGLFLES